VTVELSQTEKGWPVIRVALTGAELETMIPKLYSSPKVTGLLTNFPNARVVVVCDTPPPVPPVNTRGLLRF
jgi:hypothetical protein